jgi:hypothetical protein
MAFSQDSHKKWIVRLGLAASVVGVTYYFARKLFAEPTKVLNESIDAGQLAE